jgi:TRAP-type C4-dicarboxylate transport system permease large subunit
MSDLSSHLYNNSGWAVSGILFGLGYTACALDIIKKNSGDNEQMRTAYRVAIASLILSTALPIAAVFYGSVVLGALGAVSFGATCWAVSQISKANISGNAKKNRIDEAVERANMGLFNVFVVPSLMVGASAVSYYMMHEHT